MFFYVRLSKLSLLLGQRQLAAMLARTWLEIWLMAHTIPGERYWETLGRLTRDGVIDRRTLNRTKAVYNHLSRSIHGRNVQASTLRRCIFDVSNLRKNSQ